MNLEQGFCEIQSNSRYLHDKRSFAVEVTTSPLWHMPTPGGSRPSHQNHLVPRRRFDPGALRRDLTRPLYGGKPPTESVSYLMIRFAQTRLHLDKKSLSYANPDLLKPATSCEIGDDMARFGSADRIAAWAALCPGNNESAGKRKSARIGKGSSVTRYIMCECANSACPRVRWRPNTKV